MVSPGFRTGFAKQMSANITARKERTRKDKIARATAAKEEAEKRIKSFDDTLKVLTEIAKDYGGMSPKGQKEFKTNVFNFIQTASPAQINKASLLFTQMGVSENVSTQKKLKEDETHHNVQAVKMLEGKLPPPSPKVFSNLPPNIQQIYTDQLGGSGKMDALTTTFNLGLTTKRMENQHKIDGLRPLFGNRNLDLFGEVFRMAPDVVKVFAGDTADRQNQPLTGNMLYSTFLHIQSKIKNDPNLIRDLSKNKAIKNMLESNLRRLTQTAPVIENGQSVTIPEEQLRKNFPLIYSIIEQTKPTTDIISNVTKDGKVTQNITNLEDANTGPANSNKIKKKLDSSMVNARYVNIDKSNTLQEDQKKYLKRYFPKGSLPNKLMPDTPTNVKDDFVNRLRVNSMMSAMNLDSNNLNLRKAATDENTRNLRLHEKGPTIASSFNVAKAFDAFSEDTGADTAKTLFNSLLELDYPKSRNLTKGGKMKMAVDAFIRISEYRIDRGDEETSDMTGRKIFKYGPGLNFDQKRIALSKDQSYTNLKKKKMSKASTLGDLQTDLTNIFNLIQGVRTKGKDEDNVKYLDRLEEDLLDPKKDVIGLGSKLNSIIGSAERNVSSIKESIINFISTDAIPKLNVQLNKDLNNRFLNVEEGTRVTASSTLNQNSRNLLNSANTNFKNNLEKASTNKLVDPKLYARIAQIEYAKLALTYRLSGMVQGDSTGGRTISNADFEVMYKALWGTQQQSIPRLQGLLNKIQYQKAVLDSEIRLMNQGSYSYMEENKDLFGLDFFYEQAGLMFTNDFNRMDEKESQTQSRGTEGEGAFLGEIYGFTQKDAAEQNIKSVDKKLSDYFAKELKRPQSDLSTNFKQELLGSVTTALNSYDVAKEFVKDPNFTASLANEDGEGVSLVSIEDFVTMLQDKRDQEKSDNNSITQILKQYSQLYGDNLDTKNDLTEYLRDVTILPMYNEAIKMLKPILRERRQ